MQYWIFTNFLVYLINENECYSIHSDVQNAHNIGYIKRTKLSNKNGISLAAYCILLEEFILHMPIYLFVALMSISFFSL